MSEKIIKSRIVHKHDLEPNWLLATNFTPKQGEIIVYDIDENYSYERIKIGDGVHNVNDLPFYSGSWEDLSDKPFWSEGPTIVKWDKDTSGLAVSSDGTAYKVSDLKPSSTEVIGGKLTFSNGSVVEITSDIVETGGYLYSIYYGTVYVNTSNGSAYSDAIGVTLPEPGIYLQKNAYNQVVSFSYGNEEIHQLDEKFIPDTIARISDISEQITVDSELSATSTNPVQNKVVNDAISNLNTLVGDTSVSDQIAEATYTQAQVDTLIAAVREACMPKVTTVTLFTDEWTYSGGEYYYDVRLSCLTSNSQVNLQADATSLAILQDDGTALVPVAYGSYVRIWTVNGSPREDITVQITVQEVMEV